MADILISVFFLSFAHCTCKILLAGMITNLAYSIVITCLIVGCCTACRSTCAWGAGGAAVIFRDDQEFDSKRENWPQSAEHLRMCSSSHLRLTSLQLAKLGQLMEKLIANYKSMPSGLQVQPSINQSPCNCGINHPKIQNRFLSGTI